MTPTSKQHRLNSRNLRIKEAAVFHRFITSEFFNYHRIYIYVVHGSGFCFVYSFSISALTEGLAVGFKIHYSKYNPLEINR